MKTNHENFKFSTFARFAGKAVVILEWKHSGWVTVRFAGACTWFTVSDCQLEAF